MNNSAQPPIWTRSFVGITITHLMIFIIFYSLVTTLPLFVIRVLEGSEADGALIITIMLVSTIIVRPIAAKILEKVGKKRTLIMSVLLFTVTTFFYIWIDTYIPLLILRFIHGLSYGIASTATGAIVADVVPTERRGEGIGYFSLANNLAVVIGPFIGLTLLQFVSFETLFIVLSVLMIVGVLFALSVQVPEVATRVVEPINQPPLKPKFSISDLFEKKAMPIALLGSLVAISYASIISFISVYSDSIGLATAAGYFFVIFAVVMILSRPYFGKRFDKKGPKSVIVPCFTLFATGLILLSFTTTALMLFLAAALIGLGYGTLVPSFQTMAIQASPETRSGHATATFFTLFDLGIAIGTFIWGYVVAIFNFQQLYIICAILIIIVLGLFLQHYSKKQQPAVSKN